MTLIFPHIPICHLGIDKRFLFLIQKLCKSTTCQIKCFLTRELSAKIPCNQDVKQDCVLAPPLFNLFLNNFAPYLAEVDALYPKLGSSQISVFLYVNDADLLSCSQIDLKCLLNRGLIFVSTHKRHLSLKKSKILVFVKLWEMQKWIARMKEIKQVKCFRYLGL